MAENSNSINPIAQLGNEYHAWVRAHPHAAADFRAAFEDLLLDAGITFDRVSARVKTWPSLKAKAKKRAPDGTPAYPDPWRDIHDVIGVRVTVFHSTEIPLTVRLFGTAFRVLRSVDKTAQTRISGDFGYGSHHLILRIDEADADNLDLAAYAGETFEVQIRTILQHAWAEFEHDIRYKRGPEEPDPRVDRAFTLAAGLIELADQQFDQIAAVQAHHENPQDNVELTPETLPGILAMILGNRFPRSRSEHYRWIHELLSAAGVTTVAGLREVLDAADIELVRRAMNYRYLPSHARLIDDLLLRRGGEGYITATADSGIRPEQRPRRLRQRLEQLRRFGALPPQG